MVCKLQIIYLYSDYSGREKDCLVLKFNNDALYTVEKAYDIAKQILENNENIYVNIIEVE